MDWEIAGYRLGRHLSKRRGAGSDKDLYGMYCFGSERFVGYGRGCSCARRSFRYAADVVGFYRVERQVGEDNRAVYLAGRKVTPLGREGEIISCGSLPVGSQVLPASVEQYGHVEGAGAFAGYPDQLRCRVVL